MLHFGLGLGLICKFLDDLGVNKKPTEYNEREHFLRLYAKRESQIVIPIWVINVKINCDNNKKTSYTDAIRFLQNKD